jgi:cystathionine beta-lyase/cystathionine gamma-synthase
MLVFFRPNNIVIGDGYHGCHGVIEICTKLWGLKKISLHDEASWAGAGLGKGDIIHIETPLNPSGEASDLTYYRKKADEFGAYLTVDATFAPPPLQDPFVQGTDMIMHSGTKYFGGHSDMLCGVLAVPPARKEWLKGLWNERMYLGSVMGSMELWLGLRSLRTLELRVTRQSENATKLVAFLHEQLQESGSTVANAVAKVHHASLQKDDMVWLRKQMPGGFGPVFSLFMKDKEFARNLPGKLHLFHHATSLGGVESLVEWRRMSDKTVDERVIRVSIGIENWEDLREDFVQAFKQLGA